MEKCQIVDVTIDREFVSKDVSGPYDSLIVPLDDQTYRLFWGGKALAMAKIMKEADEIEEEILQSFDLLETSSLFSVNTMEVEPKELFQLFRDHIMQFHDRDFFPRS